MTLPARHEEAAPTFRHHGKDALPVIGGPSLSTSYLGTFLVFLYVWLLFMVLPIVAALERVPRSLVEASGDLGARPGQTFRRIVLPLALPGVVAGSIFTFSLTLGDYIIPGIIGGSQPFLGQAVYQHQGTAGNIPMAAALTAVPIAIMAVYLAVARRLVRSEEDARDIVQSAYLNAFRSVRQFEGQCLVGTWLHRIVVNTALMKLRSRRRKPEAAIDDLLPAFEADGHHVEQFSEWAMPADRLLEREDARAAVRSCIAQLPESYRQVLLLRDIEELSTDEVARMLRATPTAIKVRLHRARQALSTLLRREFAR